VHAGRLGPPLAEFLGEADGSAHLELVKGLIQHRVSMEVYFPFIGGGDEAVAFR
jgi:hypothetical protein